MSVSETKVVPNPLPCGCVAMGAVDLTSWDAFVHYKNVHVRLCHRHAATDALIEALERFCVTGNCGDHCTNSCMYCEARAALSAAKVTP